jgi:hypothetical protein
MAFFNPVVTLARVSPDTAVYDAVWDAPVVSCHVTVAMFPAVTVPPSVKKTIAGTAGTAWTMETSRTSRALSPAVAVNVIL